MEPDSFLPAVWSLDTSNVAAIQSSQTDPKIRMDSSGLFVTDTDGSKQVVVTGDGEPIDQTTGLPAPGWVPGNVVLLDRSGLRLPTKEGLFGLFKRNQQIRWERQDGSGAVVASIDSLYDPSALVGEQLKISAASPSSAPGSIKLAASATGQATSRTLLSSAGDSDFVTASDGTLPQLHLAKTTYSNTMGVGALGYSLSLPTGTTVYHGFTVISWNPAAHWAFRWFPNHVGNTVQLVIQNDSSVQTFSCEILHLFGRSA